jgi:hypothetical protein
MKDTKLQLSLSIFIYFQKHDTNIERQICAANDSTYE